MREFFEFTDTVKAASEKALAKTEKMFSQIEKIGEYNQQKVLSAFINNKVDETDFNTSTGYGYSDKGRDKLDELVADIGRVPLRNFKT